MKELENSVYKVAILTNPRLDDIEMLRMIAYYLGVTEPPTRKADILITLERVLQNNLNDGKKTVIVIDEAHAIEDKNIFEEIRLLLNFQHDDKFLLTLLILGQPELKEKIEANKQLNQRIAMRFYLEAAEPRRNGTLHPPPPGGRRREPRAVRCRTPSRLSMNAPAASRAG